VPTPFPRSVYKQCQELSPEYNKLVHAVSVGSSPLPSASAFHYVMPGCNMLSRCMRLLLRLLAGGVGGVAWWGRMMSVNSSKLLVADPDGHVLTRFFSGAAPQLDHEFINKHLTPVAESDAFQKRLLEIYNQVARPPHRVHPLLRRSERSQSPRLQQTAVSTTLCRPRPLHLADTPLVSH